MSPRCYKACIRYRQEFILSARCHTESRRLSLRLPRVAKTSYRSSSHVSLSPRLIAIGETSYQSFKVTQTRVFHSVRQSSFAERSYRAFMLYQTPNNIRQDKPLLLRGYTEHLRLSSKTSKETLSVRLHLSLRLHTKTPFVILMTPM